jgi:lipopolysaccharide export system permease protein
MIFARAMRREFVQNAVAISVALLVILLTTFLVRLLNEATVGKVSASAVGPLLGFAIFNFLPILLSLACFMAILLTLSRWYRDSEMTVWFSAGQPLTAWIRPVLIFAVPVMLVVGVLTQELVPWAHGESLKYRQQVADRNELGLVRPGVFRESSDGRRIFFIESADKSGEAVSNIFVSDTQPDKLGITVAERGRQEIHENGDRFIVLERGHRYELKPNSPEMRTVDYQEYAFRVETKAAQNMARHQDSTPTRELLGNPTRESLGDVVTRVGTTIMVAMLALLAIPLSYVNPRAGRSANMILALLVYFIYINLMTISRAWVIQGRLPFVVGLVVPHLIMISVLIWGFYYRMTSTTRGARRRMKQATKNGGTA